MKTRTWIKRVILYCKAEDSFLTATIWKSLPGYIWIYTNRHKKEWIYTSWEKVSEDFEISSLIQND